MQKPAPKICSSHIITLNVTAVEIILGRTYKHFIALVNLNDNRPWCVSTYVMRRVKINGTLRRSIYHKFSRNMSIALNPQWPRKDIISRPRCNKYSGMRMITVTTICDYCVEAQDEVVARSWECLRGVSVKGNWSVWSSSYPVLCLGTHHWKSKWQLTTIIFKNAFYISNIR